MRTPLLLAALTLTLAACGATTPATPDAPQGRTAYALDGSGHLVTFGTDNAAASLTTVKISGLAVGDQLVDLDVYRADGFLYAAGASGQIYRLETSNGSLWPVTSLGGAVVAVDFNRVAERLRVIGGNNRNFRVTLASGTVTDDGTFAYASGDVNAGKTPRLVAAAYTNSAATRPAATDLYTIDADLGILVKNTTGPQFSTLTTVGSLGVDTSGDAGFDIYSDGSVNEGYATLSRGGVTNLYTVDLATGRATLKSTLTNVALKGLAVKP